MSDNETTSTRVITIRLRIPALVLAVALVIGGLIWAFVLGIMVGRDQVNEQLEALGPTTQQSATNGSPVGSAEKAPKNSADEIEDLIKAEDLKYQENLRQNAQPPVAQADQARAAQDDSAPARPPHQAQPAAPQASASTGQQYSYLYQVASYTKESQAKELQEKLRAKGVEAQMETKIIQNTSWFRILISFKGDENSVKSMQDMLKKDFKINGILPRGKTALGG